jgi:hypothetical protein
MKVGHGFTSSNDATSNNLFIYDYPPNTLVPQGAIPSIISQANHYINVGILIARNSSKVEDKLRALILYKCMLSKA